MEQHAALPHAVDRPDSDSYCKGLSLPVPPSSTPADPHASTDQTARDVLIAPARLRVFAVGTLRQAGATMTTPAVFEAPVSVHPNVIGLGSDEKIS